MTSHQVVRRAAVLGSPIAHSLSPALHRAAYAALGLAGWEYGRHEVDEAALPGFLDRISHDPVRWAGLSLTMPLKRAVIPLIDAIGDTAAAVQAVNTVVIGDDGRRTGENTDVPGMVAALRERGVRRVESAAVLGAGATGSSALAALAGVCAGSVTVYARGAARAEETRHRAERLGVPVVVEPWSSAADALRRPLVVSTVPAGAVRELARSVPERPGTLFDVIYEPWPTPLAAGWAGQGGHVVGGLDLLVHQAVLQVELMTGRSPAPLAAMRAAGRQALLRR